MVGLACGGRVTFFWPRVVWPEVFCSRRNDENGKGKWVWEERGEDREKERSAASFGASHAGRIGLDSVVSGLLLLYTTSF